ncbi:hypothetical protein FSP39_001502 [Pinctada imbricata]|uniref:Chitin-binding type-2 domain-containing protein n=1 Tax=Pinctada imbricata TaxID=66713 RepID=A0AA88XYH5_PINIB|nr:hypothetical protein FSP39_001502 [Pinctada imbricata]
MEKVAVKYKLLVLYAIFGLVPARGPDYKGTEFIVGFMENVVSSHPVELFVTTMRTTIVNVHVSAPKSALSIAVQNFTVTAGKVEHLFFDVGFRMRGTGLNSKGILVTADDEIVLYGLNKEQYTTDGYLGLPTDVLGTEYYTMAYKPDVFSNDLSEVMIIGTGDSTTVTITLPKRKFLDDVVYNGKSYSSGESFDVSLKKYDTFQFQSRGDLTGTNIRSSYPVAVLSGNNCVKVDIGYCDHIVEMIPPIDTWGKRFVTVPIPNRGVGDKFRIIASENNTSVVIKGGYNDSFIIQNAGDMEERLIPSTAFCYVTSDKAILVAQFVRGQNGDYDDGDPSMLLVQPVGGYGTAFTFTTPTRLNGSYVHYFAIVIKDKDKDGLKIDDKHISTTFHHIPGTEYVGGYIRISPGAHTVRHNSPLVLFAGYLYGTGFTESYAFPIGMRLAPINTVCVPTSTVVGDGIDNDCDGLIDEELCTVANGRKDDDKDGRIDEDCATPSPIDGGWSVWGSWSSCSQSCKPALIYQTGVRTRTRPCTNPRPQYDGKQCPGNGTEYKTCVSTATCPVMECKKDGLSVKCAEECKDQWNFANPCKTNPSEAVNKVFVHPSDPSKFLRCDLAGKVYIVTCPQNEFFSESCHQCSRVNKTCHNGPRTPLNTTHSNPCTVSNLLAGNFFFPFAGDVTKFIHCDVWGKAWVMSCPYSEIWDQTALTCRPHKTTTTTPPPVSVPAGSGTGYICCPTCAIAYCSLYTCQHCSDEDASSNQRRSPPLHPV